ncbi:MAG: hypothetical protein HRU09_20900 [Oligoflexales bacterium]|nr:hypothetical protein [Oligoflexales bacterium]
MQNKKQTYIEKIKDIGIFRLEDAKQLGIPQRTVSWLVEIGEVRKIPSNAYLHNDFDLDLEIEQFAACQVVFGKKSYIGGLTALFHYKLVEQVPQQIWITVPPQISNHNPQYRLIRTKADLQIGVLNEGLFRIASPDRAILDSLHFKTKIGGLSLALTAARTAIREKLVTPNSLLQLASKMSWKKDVTNNWEALTIE